jgi:5'-deoxy-5'-methylthioadenosine phosphorylase
MTSKLGVIGGTGLTQLKGLEIIRREVVHTPYGEPSGAFNTGRFCGREIIFLARHGYSHRIPPHKVNYRANIWAFKHLGVEHVIAFAAVGGITKEMRPERIVVPDQIIDYTHSRPHTFFEQDLSRVTHIDFSNPYCAELRELILKAISDTSIDAITSGVYGATQGPRLETAAEIDKLERDGCNIVGMTGMPEAVLAKELGLCYSTIAVVANRAAGRGSGEITMKDIQETLEKGIQQGAKILEALFSME